MVVRNRVPNIWLGLANHVYTMMAMFVCDSGTILRDLAARGDTVNVVSL